MAMCVFEVQSSGGGGGGGGLLKKGWEKQEMMISVSVRPQGLSEIWNRAELLLIKRFWYEMLHTSREESESSD